MSRRGLRTIAASAAVLACLGLAAGSARAGDVRVPDCLRLSVGLDLRAPVREAKPLEGTAGDRLRRLAARLRGEDGSGQGRPHLWYERRAVYVGVRGRF